jgi:hypothetical protein
MWPKNMRVFGFPTLPSFWTPKFRAEIFYWIMLVSVSTWMKMFVENFHKKK